MKPRRQNLQAALVTARAAVDAAAEVVLRGAPCDHVRPEPGRSAGPVAHAQANAAARAVIRETWPDQPIHDEHQPCDPATDSVWLVDALDGRSSSVRGAPFATVRVALMQAGELVVGVSAAPAHGDVLWARRGGGAYRNGQRIRVATTKDERKAVVSLGNIRSAAGNHTSWRALGEMMTAVHQVRSHGDACRYHLLATGAVDVVLESDVGILDIAAAAVIVREAGGLVTELHGLPLTLQTRSILATGPHLHEPFRWRFQFETHCC